MIKELSNDQDRAVKRLVARSERHVNSLSEISAVRAGPGADRQSAVAALKTPRVSNCAGIFGRRGSGKTTVLASTMKELRDRDHGWVVIEPILDLSCAPSEFPYGLSVLRWLHDELRARQPARAGSTAAERAFDEASRAYFRGADGFRSLNRSLALTPEHYANTASKEIEARLRFRRHVETWLDTEAAEGEVSGFVIAIDDLDLAPANQHHSLIWSLLDELHQDRLFLLVAADLARLEAHVAQEDASTRRAVPASPESSLPTARDLVYKVIPQVDRCELDPWPAAERAQFPPGEARNIGQLVSRSALRPILAYHLPRLLPQWARGLENVLRELEHRLLDPGKLADASTERELLGFLAESTFDFPLARALRERPLAEWAGYWSWPELTGESDTTWTELQRQLSGEDEDLRALLPDLKISPLPLDLERIRWVEVLLDVALSERRITAERLVPRVPLLHARAARCQVEVTRSWESIANAAEDAPACTVAALAWSQWAPLRSSDAPAQFAVGLAPFLALVAGRPAWSEVFEAQVFRGRDELLARMGDEQLRATLARGLGPEVGAEVLPARSRTMLRFLDRVGHQPWPALGLTSSQVGPVGYARLAATFVYRSLREVAAEERYPSGAREPSLPINTHLDEAVREIARGSDIVQKVTEQSIGSAFQSVAQQARADMEILLRSDADTGFDLHQPAHAALLRLLRSPAFRGLDPALEGPAYPA